MTTVLQIIAWAALVWAIAFSLFMVLMIGALLVEEFIDWLEARRRQKCWDSICKERHEWEVASGKNEEVKRAA